MEVDVLTGSVCAKKGSGQTGSDNLFVNFPFKVDVNLKGMEEFEVVVDAVRESLCRRSMHKASLLNSSAVAHKKNGLENPDAHIVSWNWAATKLLDLLSQFPSGVTDSIALSELEVMWDEARDKFSKGTSKRIESFDGARFGESVSRAKVYEATAKNARMIPNTGTYLLSFEDGDSGSTVVDMYLHHKFYFLASLPQHPNFFNQRVIRMTGTTTTPSSIPKKLLPTELMLPMLSESNDADVAWLRQQFTHVLANINVKEARAGAEYYFLLKVQSIIPGPVNIDEKGQTRWVLLNDTLTEEGAVLVLYEDQMGMCELFKKGDWLAIRRPYVNTKFHGVPRLEYGSETVMCCIPSEIENELRLSQHKVEDTDDTDALVPDKQGTIDCAPYPHRILIKDVKPNMLNLNLLGKITLMVPNMPCEPEKGKKSDRFGIRLADHTGTTDITLWDEVGRGCRSFRVGQVILIENLRTSEWKKNGRFYVVGTKDQGTRISCDGPCGHPLETPSGVLQCRFCAQYPEKGEHMTRFFVTIDDGTGQINAEASNIIAEELLGVSTATLRSMDQWTRESFFESFVSHAFEFCITGTKDKGSEKLNYRIDAVVPLVDMIATSTNFAVKYD
ncbi:hypothetical protein HDV05_007537 [Chytridiales sp. JEL 0842]|nr:hypothetical protein HDV05_007537 [Chytridiales sp. JEL 0842]